MDERGRSSEDIRQDIAREEENLSRTARQIGDRIKEKLDWSQYVKESPYWALGIAAGIGFFASRVLRTLTAPTERIIGPLAGKVGDSRGGLYVRAVRPGLAKAVLLGIGTKLATEWISKTISTSGSSGCGSSPTQAGRDSICNPRAAT